MSSSWAVDLVALAWWRLRLDSDSEWSESVSCAAAAIHCAMLGRHDMIKVMIKVTIKVMINHMLSKSWAGVLGRAGLVLAWGKTGLGSGQQSWKQINKCWLYTFCNTHCYYYSLLDWFPIGSCWPQLALLAPIVVMLFSATERICENWSCSHSSTRWKS